MHVYIFFGSRMHSKHFVVNIRLGFPAEENNTEARKSEFLTCFYDEGQCRMCLYV